MRKNAKKETVNKRKILAIEHTIANRLIEDTAVNTQLNYKYRNSGELLREL